MRTNFQAKQTSLTFLTQICPKMNFGLEIQKTNVLIRINVLQILILPIFKQKRQLCFFCPKFAQKFILRSEFQKSYV